MVSECKNSNNSAFVLCVFRILVSRPLYTKLKVLFMGTLYLFTACQLCSDDFATYNRLLPWTVCLSVLLMIKYLP